LVQQRILVVLVRIDRIELLVVLGLGKELHYGHELYVLVVANVSGVVSVQLLELVYGVLLQLRLLPHFCLLAHGRDVPWHVEAFKLEVPQLFTFLLQVCDPTPPKILGLPFSLPPISFLGAVVGSVHVALVGTPRRAPGEDRLVLVQVELDRGLEHLVQIIFLDSRRDRASVGSISLTLKVLFLARPVPIFFNSVEILRVEPREALPGDALIGLFGNELRLELEQSTFLLKLLLHLLDLLLLPLLVHLVQPHEPLRLRMTQLPFIL